MKIQPVADNAIVIELDDGSSLKMHNTVHGDISYLFISGNVLTVEIMKGLNWEHLAVTRGMIRVSSKA